MTSKPATTRFAPSPTGYLHVGGARTALYNYLLAKKTGGQFILRIEDTDRERSTDEAVQAILEGMRWLGLKEDLGPFYQTKRFDLYNKEIDRLIVEKKAYPCFCKAEDLQKKREEAQAKKEKYRYDRTCHVLTEQEVTERIGNNEAHVIRFYSQDNQNITIKDHIKGEVTVNSNELDDLILRRTDGNPTYNFTVVVDDADMKVTHVIRGDDHLNNAFRQVQLYKALGYDLPDFAHIPLILGTDKKRLSKRHGATSVMAYKDMGYLPEAVLNYLVRLGWGHGDDEIFSLQEMIDKFSLEGCNSSPAVFNSEKLDWLNSHYIKQKTPEELCDLVEEQLKEFGVDSLQKDKLPLAIKTSQEKAKTLKELAEKIALFFKPFEGDAEVLQKNLTDEIKPVLQDVRTGLQDTATLNHDSIHAVFESVMNKHGLKLGKVANPVRVALSGQKASPGAYDLIEVFGKEESLKRLDAQL